MVISADQKIKAIKDVVAKVAEDHGTLTPAETLAMAAAGLDPRYDTSPLYDMVQEIHEAKRLPDQREWDRLAHIVLRTPAYRRSFLDIKETTAAAKLLMDYLYLKAKDQDAEAYQEPVATLAISPEELEELAKKLDQDF